MVYVDDQRWKLVVDGTPRKIALDYLNTMALVRVPTIGPFSKNLIDNRHFDAVENDGDKEKFDVGFSEFPICALSDHREGQYEKAGKA